MQTKNSLDLAGLQLQKSAHYQYAAMGFSAASLVLSIGSVSATDDYEYKNNELVKKENKSRKAMLIGGGICAVIAVAYEIYSINLKLKAGKSLRLYATENGGGLSLNF